MAGPANFLLQQIAQGAQPRMADAMSRGYTQGANMLANIQQQQDRNALAQVAQAYGQGGPQAARDAAAKLGQYQATVAADNTLYGRGRDQVGDQRDARNFGYRQQRDQVGDQQWNQQFNANRDWRRQTMAERRQARQDSMNAAANKPTASPYGKPTADSAKAAGFYDRMAASEKILSSPEGVKASMDRGNIAWDTVANATPFRFGAGELPEDYKKYDQARRDFINAALRRESGAVISPEEFANARQQYFPQPGDTDAVIEQKRQNRQIVIDGMRRSGLPSLAEPSAASQQPDMATGATAPDTGNDPLGIRN